MGRAPGPLILIELPSISLRIWSHVPSREETVAVVKRALNAIGHESGEQSFIDNLLVRIHVIIEMIWSTGLAPWEFEFPFSGSPTLTFLVFQP